MSLTSKIVPYDVEWPGRYEAEVERLSPILHPMMTLIHHVGSTAVPDLAAKPEIDVLAVMGSNDISKDCVEELRGIGYRRGNDLSQGHAFFKREKNGIRTHKLHLCREGHSAIGDMLRFRDRLRDDRQARIAYGALKIRLEAENRDGIAEYIAGKAPFIRAIVEGSQGS